MLAWPLIIKGKPLEMMGRKAMGAKAHAMPARPLIIISKPPEMTGRKAMGAKVRRHYASPAAGYFASELAKEGMTIMKNMRKMGRKCIALFLVLLLFSLNSLTVLAEVGETGYDSGAATWADFNAACDAMGDADDEASIMAVLNNIEAVYNKLSDEDKAAVADQWEYVQSYRASINAGNPDEGIETMASMYNPVTIQARVICQKPWTEISLGGNDKAYAGNGTETYQAYYTIPSLDHFLSGTGYEGYSYGSVLKVVGSYHLPSSGNSSVGANVEFGTNKSTQTITYWVSKWEAPHTHSYSWTPTKAPTCTEKGTETNTCSCGATNGTREIAALGHAWPLTWTDGCTSHTDADCNQHERICTRCNAVLNTADHTYPNEWTVVTAATTTAKGQEKRVCTACGHTIYRDIDQLTATYAVRWMDYDPDAGCKQLYRLDNVTEDTEKTWAEVKADNQLNDPADYTENGKTYTWTGEWDVAWNADNTLKTYSAKYAEKAALATEYKDVVFSVQSTFRGLENDLADLPENFELHYTITNAKYPEWSASGVLKLGDSNQGSTYNGGYGGYKWTDIPVSIPADADPECQITITAVNAGVEGYVCGLATGGDNNALTKAQEVAYTNTGNEPASNSSKFEWEKNHTMSYFVSYAIPQVAVHTYYDKLENGVPAIVNDTQKVTDKAQYSGTIAWKSVKNTEYKTYNEKNYIRVEQPADDAKITLATVPLQHKYVRAVTVTWKNGYNDESVKTETIPNGATIPDYPAAPEREGYEFDGWSEPVTDDDGNITITAKWKEEVVEVYTVTYTDGVNGAAFEDQIRGDLKEGVKTPAFDGTPQRDGYIFADWSPEVADTVTGDATYTAQWKEDRNGNNVADETEYRTVIYTDGVDDEVVFEDQKTEELLDGDGTPAFKGTPEREGYIFTGWTPEVAEEVKGNATYIAQWEKATENPDPSDEPKEATYTVEWYDADGNSLKDETRTGAVGNEATVTEADKALEGYTFNTDDERNVLSEVVNENGSTVLKLYFTENDPVIPPGPGSDDPTPGPGSDDPVNPPVDPTPTTPGTPTPGPTPVTPAAPAVTPAITPIATPAAPLAAAPAVAPVVQVADEETPLANVPDEQVPLAKSDGYWALLNFALMNLAIFESIMLLIGYFVRTKNNEEEEANRKLKRKGIFRISSILVAVISLVAFILTEDIHLKTAFVDSYTIYMLLIAVVQTAIVALSKKKYVDEDKDMEMQEA